MKMFFLVFSIILAISLVFGGLLYLLRRRFGKTGPAVEHLHPSVFSFFTTIYAFFLGFAIATLWSAFLSAQTNVSQEAAAILNAYRLSRDLPNSGGFRQALAAYTRSVIEDEWDTMESKKLMSDRTQQHLDQVWAQLLLLRPANKNDNALYVQVGNRLSEAGQQRLSRTLFTKSNLYPPIWVIIVFGFLTVLYGLYFNHMQQNAVRLIFDFMVIFVVLCCIFFIYDIDTPFPATSR